MCIWPPVLSHWIGNEGQAELCCGSDWWDYPYQRYSFCVIHRELRFHWPEQSVQSCPQTWGLHVDRFTSLPFHAPLACYMFNRKKWLWTQRGICISMYLYFFGSQCKWCNFLLASLVLCNFSSILVITVKQPLSIIMESFYLWNLFLVHSFLTSAKHPEFTFCELYTLGL